MGILKESCIQLGQEGLHDITWLGARNIFISGKKKFNNS